MGELLFLFEFPLSMLLYFEIIGIMKCILEACNK